MTVEANKLEGQGICFQRGPLLFSYAIPQQMTEDTEEYECMHGKKSENPDFKCWNIMPTGNFNYAYATDGQPIQVSHPAVAKTEESIPFDKQYAPVRLRIPVRQIDWDLVDNRFTPHLPEQGHLTLLGGEREYIDLVPYGCTELRLTVFPDADAPALPQPEEPDYTRPADAPDCVQVEDGRYGAFFELPRFCWDEPVYCKVRTAGNTDVDLHSNQGGDPCTMVGTTDNGRHIWYWKGAAISEAAPVEIIFTNGDLLTCIMPFANGGYYNYDELLYKAGQTTGIKVVRYDDASDDCYYDLQGHRFTRKPSTKGIYLHQGKKVIVK